MDLEVTEVIKDLNKRFAQPLPEFYLRRIIFWYDEEKQFVDKISDIVLENAQFISYNGSNNFALKKLLTIDNTTDNFCVYLTETCPDEENWLLPIILYSEEYRTDIISRWINEMKLENIVGIRKTVKEFQSFFKSKGHRSKILHFSENIRKPVHLQKAILGVLCGTKDTNPNVLIRSILCAGLEVEKNGLFQAILKNKIEPIFWAMVQQVTGYSEEKPNLERLACHILLTAASRLIGANCFLGLEEYIDESHTSYCYDLVSEWCHSDKLDELYNISHNIEEEELNLFNRFMHFDLKTLSMLSIFPIVNECILSKIMTDVCNNIINVSQIREITEKRRTLIWYNDVKDYYEGLTQIANMQEFYLQHSMSFHTVEAFKVWNEYINDYYKMDSSYRLFHISFAHSLNISHPLLDDLFKQVADKAECLYKNWFLEKLGDNWVTACSENLAEYGKILNVPQQNDFYKQRIQPSENRTFVIISDAMRYEVAASLADDLRVETTSQVKLDAMQAIYPSVTKFGMAALLPHKKLTADLKDEDKPLCVLADGSSTDSTYRDKILKSYNPKSVALKYKDLIKMKRDERSSLVKGMDIVYIYHDKIDETGHVNEENTFVSCNDAIIEVKNMVKIIINEFSGTHILITADHGFLYTYQALQEDCKVDKTTTKDEDIEVDRRYIITKTDANPEYLFPVKFLDDNNFKVYAAAPNMRIKKKGGSINYVHGGISLQELVVPVIDYHYMRSSSAEYKKNKNKYDTIPVTLNLISPNHRISNRVFSLNFYQNEPVGEIHEATTYKLYIENSERICVSDIQKIIADKTSKDNQDRTFKVQFNLKSIKFSNKESYYLVIMDESGVQMPKREEFTIDITFAFDDFDFFS